MTIQEKIQNEKRNIQEFYKNPALSKKQKGFYIQMFKENIRRLRAKESIHQEN